MTEQKLTKILKLLWAKKILKTPKNLNEIKSELSNLDCNPSDQNLCMGLKNAKYLTRKGSKGNYKYVQKYASKGILLNNEILPKSLIGDLRTDFQIEINDLHLNFGRSGTCTAFLLRKILEKLIFLSFAKNNLQEKLKDASGDFVGLKTMINLSTILKVNGKPFLMPRTAKEIEGIKFLGDTSAHNPITNVKMETIIPQMPFIITAYEELSKKL